MQFSSLGSSNMEIWMQFSSLGSSNMEIWMQFSSLGSSNMEIWGTGFFDTLTIQNDQISHVKHVLAPLYVVFTLFGCWGWGAPKGALAQPAYAVLNPQQLNNGGPSPLFEVPCRRQ